MTTLVAISLLFQAAAAGLALWLIRMASARAAWLLISVGLGLMAVRRGLTLISLVEGAPAPFAPEVVALASSALMLGGIALLGPYFRTSRQAVESLRRSEERHRELVERLPQGAVHVDPEGPILDANPAALRILGLTREELLERSCVDERWQTVRADGTPCPAEEHPARLALSTGREVRDTVVGVHNGSRNERRWLQVQAVPEYHPGETRPHRVFLTFDDITDRKRADDGLRKSEQRFRKLVEHSPDSIALLDARGNITFTTQATTRILGYPEAEILGMNAFDLVHPEERHDLMRRLPGLLVRPQQPGFAEVRLRHRDGGYRHVEGVFTNLLANPAVGGIVVNFRDVTERRRAEEALRDSERRFRMAVSAARMGIWSWSLNTARLEWSEGVAPLFGLAEGALPRRPQGWLDLVHPEDRKSVRRAVERLRSGESYVGEHRVLQRDGRTRWLMARADVRRDATGTVVAVVGTLLDTTERRHLEEQLLRSQKLESIGQLAGGVAHDFNNLLTAILGYLELADGLMEPSSTAAGHLGSARQAAERAAELTSQLLAYARKQIIRPRVLDLNGLIRDTERMLRRVIGEPIDLVTTLASGLWPVKADPGQLQQVLTSLVVNARDAMPGGGRLTVATSNVELDEGQASLLLGLRPGPHVVLTVTDTGAGMSPEVQARIFEPYYSTRAQGKGTGLGLATVYGIVHQNQGHIQALSEVGTGTTFEVYLPRASEQTDSPEAARPGSENPRGSETVLLVEDEETVRDMARRVLESLGYRVLVARDGEEGLRCARTCPEPVHLLVTDVVMPRLGGKELADRLLAQRPDLRVLFMSGYAEDSIVQQGVLEPDVWFLSKPFTVAALARKVREVLDAPA